MDIVIPTVLHPYQERVFNERLALDNKIRDLNTFLTDRAGRMTNIAERELMLKQLTVMREYSLVLGERLHMWGVA